jgi:hypothetical protein
MIQRSHRGLITAVMDAPPFPHQRGSDATGDGGRAGADVTRAGVYTYSIVYIYTTLGVSHATHKVIAALALLRRQVTEGGLVLTSLEPVYTPRVSYIYILPSVSLMPHTRS